MEHQGIWPLIFMLLGACKPPAEDSGATAGGNPNRGRAIIEATGCAACHVVPGIAWPKGKVGPDLTGFADQTLLAGRFPNQPHLVERWVRDAPSMIPDAAMPAMPISEGEARDVAAYLYTLRTR